MTKRVLRKDTHLLAAQNPFGRAIAQNEPDWCLEPIGAWKYITLRNTGIKIHDRFILHQLQLSKYGSVIEIACR